MEQKSYSDSYIHISEANKKALQEVKERMAGKATGLMTRWPRLNRIMGGGLQWGQSYLIAALSGSGKSTISNIIETDVFDLNPREKIKLLNFNFETESYRNIIKKYSADMQLDTNEILSSERLLSEDAFKAIEGKAARFDEYPIYYFDNSGSVSQIYDSIIRFQSKNPYNKLVVILDHTALINLENEQDEMEMLTRLGRMSIELKKETGCIIVLLGQLNSNIEQVERLSTPALHYPMRSDLFSAKAVYNAMDNVFIPHRPEILGIQAYGMHKYPTKDVVFWHILKQRYGKVGYIKMRCDFKYNKLEEIQE